eukprot:457625-Prymnesium_polylepis.1
MPSALRSSINVRAELMLVFALSSPTWFEIMRVSRVLFLLCSRSLTVTAERPRGSGTLTPQRCPPMTRYDSPGEMEAENVAILLSRIT